MRVKFLLDPLHHGIMVVLGGNSKRWVSSLGPHIGLNAQNKPNQFRLNMIVNMIGGSIDHLMSTRIFFR